MYRTSSVCHACIVKIHDKYYFTRQIQIENGYYSLQELCYFVCQIIIKYEKIPTQTSQWSFS